MENTKKLASNTAIAYQQMLHIATRGYAPRWYVSDLPGCEGAKRVKGSTSDWGWTDNADKALPLSPYWQRRFMAYGKACGWRHYGIIQQ